MTPQQYDLRALDIRREIAEAKTDCERLGRECRAAQTAVGAARGRLGVLRGKLRALKDEWAKQAAGDTSGGSS